MRITTTTGCEGSFTMITVEFFSLMDSSDVHITVTTGCEGSFTKITVDSLTLMDSFDVVMNDHNHIRTI